MSNLTLNFLGDFKVLRDGQEASLPPSKKTRALLAYLALNDRRYRREYLSELLWEIPDDPRGSLRWSLSKLRRVVDDEDTKRIVADRSSAAFDAEGVTIDSRDLLALADGTLADARLEELETAADRYQGNFLEGLELSNFHDFHAWCVAERERVLRAQATLLQELVRRHADDPEAALPYARRLVAITPYDEDPRANLIRMLMLVRHTEEAEQQYQLGKRMLKEIGAVSTGALHAARIGNRGQAEQPPGQQSVAAKAKPAAPPAPAVTGIVGRKRELTRLSEIYVKVVRDSRARVVMLSGDPGIGKSRIIAAAVALTDSQGALLLSANAYESESLRPYALWTDALRRKIPDVAADVFAENSAGNRDRLLEKLSRFIEAEAQDGPVVLVFDDIHWCDESSAAAVHFVVRMNRDLPIVILLAGRTSELQDSVPLQRMMRGLRRDDMLDEIELGPLREEALQQLIQERAPGADAERLSGECGGNALLAIELARAELEGESGASLNDLVRERLARLDVDGAEVLHWAAVLGPLMSIEMLAQLTGLSADRVGGVLDAAERQAMLVVTDTGLGFAHDLVARGVYNDISPLRRRVMHRRIAELLEKSAALDLSRAADLAHHASQSGDPGLAARAMVSAARLCLRFFANDDALSLARKGQQLVDSLPASERVCVAIDLHAIMQSAAPIDDPETEARECIDLAEQAVDHGELAHARLGYHLAAYVRWLHGQWSEAREQSLQSERVVRSGKIEDQVAGMADTAKCLVLLERDLPQADAMLMEAEALALRQGIKHPSLPAGIGMLRFYENKLDEAEELLKEARTMFKADGARFDEFQMDEYLAMIDLEREDFAGALARSAALCEIADKLRGGSEGPFARSVAGLCEYALENEREAFDTAVTELRVADAKHRLAYIQIKAAQIDLKRGKLDSAIARAAEALDLATLLQRATEIALARTVLASAVRARGDDKLAAKHDAALDAMISSGIAQWAQNYIESLRNEPGEDRP